MRPVQKLQSGEVLLSGRVVLDSYVPHGSAYLDLDENLGRYCSYCEVFSTDLEVEHIVSQNQDDTKTHLWSNFLLACGRCNGKDNKSNKHVEINDSYFPHKNNTLLIFEYREAGLDMVRGTLLMEQQRKANDLIDLVGLDKYEGNPKYSAILPRDIRWKERRIAWELADRYLADFEKGERTASDIANFAAQRGFFSVWVSVFSNHKDVKEAFVQKFQGTASNCFDADFNSIPRNPGKPDPI